MSEHPDLVVLTELTDGELSGEQADTVRAHVAGCPRCQDSQARLAEVRERLHELGAGTDRTVPAAVAGRVAAALAAEAGEPIAPSTGRPAAATPLARRRRIPTGALLAACVVVLLVLVIGGGMVLGTRHGGDSQRGASSSSAVRAVPTPSTIVAGSGQDYTAAATDRAVQRLLSGSTGPQAGGDIAPNIAGGSETGSADALATLRTPAGLSACVLAVADGGRPLAVDYARWQGQPAAVIVLPGTRAGTVTVYVVPADCGPQHATFLYYHEVRR